MAARAGERAMTLSRDELVAQHGDRAVVHSERFRRVSTRYPHMVALAYGHELDRAAADSDEQVAATVAAWERAHGRDERQDDEEDAEA
jgi:hypothetical protein